MPHNNLNGPSYADGVLPENAPSQAMDPGAKENERASAQERADVDKANASEDEKNADAQKANADKPGDEPVASKVNTSKTGTSKTAGK